MLSNIKTKIYKAKKIPLFRGVMMKKRVIRNGSSVKCNQIIKKLTKENKSLKETLKTLSSSEFIKQLNNSLEDIKHGRYKIS